MFDLCHLVRGFLNALECLKRTGCDVDILPKNLFQLSFHPASNSSIVGAALHENHVVRLHYLENPQVVPLKLFQGTHELPLGDSVLAVNVQPTDKGNPLLPHDFD